MLAEYSAPVTKSTKRIVAEHAGSIGVAQADTCKLCGPLHVVSREGIWICLECGQVLGSVIEMKPERGDYSSGNPYNDTSNSLFRKSAVSTNVVFARGSAYENLTKYNLQAVPSVERSMKGRCRQLTRYAANRVPANVIERAMLIYNQVTKMQKTHSDKPICRGNNSTGLQAACLATALGEHKLSRDEKEIANMFNIDPKYVTKGKKKVFDMLNVYGKFIPRMVTWKDMYQTYCNHVSLSKRDTEEVGRILEIVYKKKLLDRHTVNSNISGCIRFVTKMHSLNLSLEQISKHCGGVSTNTIESVYKQLFANIQYFYTTN